MSKEKSIQIIEFEDIVKLIYDARNRAFSKVNEELVFLYFNVGQVVSIKVASGVWGEGTIDELANHIANKLPRIVGFNRRGLYRIKQFYETYSVDSDCSQIWLNVQTTGQNTIVLPIAAQLKTSNNTDNEFVSSPMIQLQDTDNQHSVFVSTLLTQIQWSSHLHILSKTKNILRKTILPSIGPKRKTFCRELERQLNSAVFERTLLSKQKASTLMAQMPQNLFKDPYVFEFLDLPEGHSETDLEKALVLNLQKFILEIGKGYTSFLSRSPRQGC